jgi:hypothetical protein
VVAPERAVDRRHRRSLDPRPSELGVDAARAPARVSSAKLDDPRLQHGLDLPRRHTRTARARLQPSDSLRPVPTPAAVEARPRDPVARALWGKEIRFRRAAVLVIGSDCASCWCVCCIGSCAASFACSPGAAVSGSSKSSSCAISWRSSGEEGSGRGTRPSTERCWPRPAGTSARALVLFCAARGRFAAGTGRCLREVAEDAVAGLAVPRLRLRRAASSSGWRGRTLAGATCGSRVSC